MKPFLLMLILFSSTAFAQDMSQTQSSAEAYKETHQGRLYVGKCTTHQDYDKRYFTVSHSLLNTIEPALMSEAEIDKILEKFDPRMVKLVLETFGMKGELKNVSVAKVLKQNVDDLTVETLAHKLSPQLELTRFNLGVGGGNGGFATILSTAEGFQLMSFEFDGDLEFCDKKVWLN